MGAASGVFAAANLNPQYAEAAVLEILNGPERFTETFSFLGKTDPADGQIFLVWNGDTVFHTDL